MSAEFCWRSLKRLARERRESSNSGNAFLAQRQREMRNRKRRIKDTIYPTMSATFFYDINDENGISRWETKEILSYTKCW